MNRWEESLILYKKRYYNLDLIKVVASILIVFHHYQQTSGAVFNGINFFGGDFYWGYLVELFFVISGFVMAASNNQEKSIIRRFVGKCIRIYPGTILACTVAIVIAYTGYFLHGEFQSTSVDYMNIGTIITSYTLTFCGWCFDMGLGINNPTWYLCVLLLCYIIYYVIEFISQKVRVSKDVFYIFIFGVSFVAYYLEKTLPWFFTYQSLRGYIGFFLGVLLHDLIVTRFSDEKIRVIVLGLALLTALGTWLLGIGSWGVLILFLYPTLVLLAVSVKQVSAKVSYLAVVSYEIYLWHGPCLSLLSLIGYTGGIQMTHSYFTMILFTVFVCLVSALIYRWYEVPVTRWLRLKLE